MVFNIGLWFGVLKSIRRDDSCVNFPFVLDTICMRQRNTHTHRISYGKREKKALTHLAFVVCCWFCLLFSLFFCLCLFLSCIHLPFSSLALSWRCCCDYVFILCARELEINWNAQYSSLGELFWFIIYGIVMWCAAMCWCHKLMWLFFAAVVVFHSRPRHIHTHLTCNLFILFFF